MNSAGPILGVHTGSRVEAAAISGAVVAAECTDRQALEGLLPLVRRSLQAVNSEIGLIRAVAVCRGPGSFTGLRIGVAFCKSLAQALEIPAIGVSAFDVDSSLRASFEGSIPRVVAIEGKRDFFYARIRHSDDDEHVRVAGSRDEIFAVAVEELGAALGSSECERAFRAWQPSGGSRASAVAALGSIALEAGEAGRWQDLAIDYGQRPNAVVNWERRHTSS